ncbi:hypothetical protein VTI74DRAFT_3717 [Chaetomium olivicolor]
MLFETPDSVIDLLWDVALAFFVVRLALIYSLLTFACTSSLLFLLHRLPAPLSTAASDHHTHHLPLITLSSAALCAYVCIKHYEVPRVPAFRLAVGVAAAVLAMLAEGVVGLVWYEVLGGKGMGEMLMGGWMTWMGVMGLFAAMPVLLLGFERKCEDGRLGWAAGRAREKESVGLRTEEEKREVKGL